MEDTKLATTAVRGVARWEVDGSDGSITGISNSMYLVTGIFTFYLFDPYCMNMMNEHPTLLYYSFSIPNRLH